VYICKIEAKKWQKKYHQKNVENGKNCKFLMHIVSALVGFYIIHFLRIFNTCSSSLIVHIFNGIKRRREIFHENKLKIFAALSQRFYVSLIDSESHFN
jgi:hypothetical protein